MTSPTRTTLLLVLVFLQFLIQGDPELAAIAFLSWAISHWSKWPRK